MNNQDIDNYIKEQTELNCLIKNLSLQINKNWANCFMNLLFDLEEFSNTENIAKIFIKFGSTDNIKSTFIISITPKNNCNPFNLFHKDIELLLLNEEQKLMLDKIQKYYNALKNDSFLHQTLQFDTIIKIENGQTNTENFESNIKKEYNTIKQLRILSKIKQGKNKHLSI